MKKLFTLIATALVAMSVNAQTKLSVGSGWETTIEDAVLTGDIVFNYKNAYATVYMDITEIDLSQYPSFQIVVSEDTPIDKLQLYLKSNDGSADHENWSGTFAAGTTTISFVPEGAKKITSIGLQAANVADLGKVEIVSASLIDVNGNKTALNYQAPASWAADVMSPIADVTVSFTKGDQWNFASIKGAEGLALPQTITVTAESFPANVQLKIVDSNNKEYYKLLPEGESSFTADIISETEGATIASIDLQNTVAQAPFKIKKVNVEIKPYVTPTAINTAKVAAQQGGVRYNLAGQKVNDSYKGVVIMNGRKMVVK